MDAVKEDTFGGCITENQDTSDDQLISSESPHVNDIFGDPQVLPRVGDQYQVDIPPLLTESDHLQLPKNPISQDCAVDINDSFQMLLPIPIMWIHDISDNTKNESLDLLGALNGRVKKTESIESESIKERDIDSKCEGSKLKFEPSESVSNDERGLEGTTNCDSTALGIESSVGLSLSQHEIPKLEKCNRKECFPVPGSSSSSWSNFEQESFLLGLYIFGKDLVQVKNFIGSKDMGDILSLYYGKFYRSDEYRRWSECRRIRSKKCIHGHRLFTGWRQQELLSRLLPHVSEECQNVLLEVSRRFGDGKISLEEYVMTLKAKVGMSSLIEAVGIGKGNQDLTGIVSDPHKANQVSHTRLEVPIGKACASLTSGEILRYLTGDFRLSKARANDIFWEAVWPRLLENGWHSEQPKNQAHARSKHPLVFLVPGIKKFSRRKLVKKHHYFDSVSDVLNKVASEPRHLDLEIEAHKGSKSHEEYEHELKGDSQFGQRRCYLQPPVSNTSSDLKFTVVDTSSVLEDELGKIRSVRCLPVDAIKGSAPHISIKDRGGSYEKKVDKLEFTGILSREKMNTESSDLSKHISDQVVSSDLSGCSIAVPKQEMPTTASKPSHNAQTDFPKDLHNVYQSSRVNAPMHIDPPKASENDGKSSLFEKYPSKIIKCQFTRRRKREQIANLAPVTKRRSLTDCSHEDATRGTNTDCIDSGVKEEAHNLDLSSHSGSDSMLLKDAKVSTDNTEDAFEDNFSGKTTSLDENLPRDSFNPNLPHFSQDSHLLEVSHMATVEEKPVTTTRRQGTRNRPLTTKALEALASGFLTTKRKWRCIEPISEEKLIRKPSKRVRGNFSITNKYHDAATSTKDCKENEGLHEECSSDRIVNSGSQVFTERVS